MKGASKVIMGATLVMVVSLAIVLALILVLLVELYCTLLLRRRQLRIPSSNGIAANTSVTISPTNNTNSPQRPRLQNHLPSRTTYYAPGVLEVECPRSLFYPYRENKGTETRNQRIQVHTQESISSPQHIGLIRPPSSPTSPGEIQIQINANDKACVDGSGGGEAFVYISNPIYNNDGSGVETPFETPHSSPSRLETGGGSSGDEEVAQPSPSSPATPPLTPMKKLPAEACSVSLRDARSLLGTSGSDSVSNNCVSSSSSGSPCTSPSW